MLKGIKHGREVKRKGQQASNKELKEIMEYSPELGQAARGGPGEMAGDNKWSRAENWFIQWEMKVEAKEETYTPLNERFYIYIKQTAKMEREWAW